MPPQPLSKVKPGARVSFHPLALTLRPAHATQIAKVFACWSDSDALLANSTAQFLKADYEIVSAMLQALSSAEARRDVILAAAKESLSPEDYLLFRAVLNVTRASRNRRNEFAHHLWGVSDDLLDAVLLADPKIILQPLTDMRARIRDNPLEDKPYVEAPDASQIYVYRERDLGEEVDHASRAHLHILNLIFLAQDSRLGGGPTRGELLSEPQIRQQYEKLVREELPAPRPGQQK